MPSDFKRGFYVNPKSPKSTMTNLLNLNLTEVSCYKHARAPTPAPILIISACYVIIALPLVAPPFASVLPKLTRLCRHALRGAALTPVN